MTDNKPPTPSESKSGSHGKGSLWGLSLGALGVVFGDIGTSPLYTFQECAHGASSGVPTNEIILGILSLIFWSLMAVVTFKYVLVLMNADNDGEGGIMALLALVPPQLRQVVGGRIGIVSLMVIAGAALLFGDGVITPAISVLSAVEGLSSVSPQFSTWVLPLTVAILITLFAIQSQGTGALGKFFGPIMLIWFATLAYLGVANLSSNPEVLWALMPNHAFNYLVSHGFRGFALLGSVVLAVTGGEALYADMGHFGKAPMRLSWLAIVFPSLVLNYFGQGALIMRDPAALEACFFSMVSSPNARLGLVILATVATIIASQALISAVFSLTHQAIRLGYFPRVEVRHTSREMIGQIYLPVMNWFLMIACVILVLVFKKSSDLAAAYGLAVSGTMALTSIIFYHAMRHSWGWPKGRSLALVAFFLSFDLPFLGATSLKFFEGGYVPFTIGLAIFALMAIWCRGRSLLREHLETVLTPVQGLAQKLTLEGIQDVPGVGVYLASDVTRVPNALDCQMRRLHSIFEKVVLLSVTTASSPVVESGQNLEWTEDPQGHLYFVRAHYGFMEFPDVPKLFAEFRESAGLQENIAVTYIIGRENFDATSAGRMSAWQETIFAFLSRNSQDASKTFHLPPDQVIEIVNRIDL